MSLPPVYQAGAETGCSHAQKRARERYGLDLSADDLAFIVEQIEGGKAMCLKQSKRRQKQRALYLLKAPGTSTLIRVVYQPSHRAIVTVMPLMDSETTRQRQQRRAEKRRVKVPKNEAPLIEEEAEPADLSAINDPKPANTLLGERLAEAMRKAG